MKRGIPVLLREKSSIKDIKDFPVDHYSYSGFVQMTSNPIMFKIKNINGDTIETTSRASNVLGRGVHNALSHYFGGCDNVISNDEGERIKEAFVYGQKFVLDYNDGFIEWTTAIPNRTKLEEKYSQCFFGYMKEFPKKEIKTIWFAEKMLKHKVNLDGKTLPIPLKGSADLVYEDHKGRIVIWDHKFTSVYSRKDEIDAPKLVQAVFNFLLVYAETGIAPYKMVFAEYKTSENRDKSNQMMPFEIIFKDTPLMFELFYRLYEDITDMLMGVRQPFLPNLTAMYDKEVAIMAYIHNLDDNVNRDKQFKKMDVSNITDLLKKKIEKTGNMKKYMEIISKNFISANTLNYKTMNTQDKIKMKLAEHGIAVEYHSKTDGRTVELYRYEPSIGLKMSRIDSFVKDIEQVVEVSGVRVLAPIRGTSLVGFEIPKKDRTFPTVIPKNKGFELAIGEDVNGEVKYFDIRKAPHMLIAGTSGSGKSVFINSLITQLLSVPNVELHLFDPKKVELNQFEDEKKVVEYNDNHKEIPTLLHNLVKDMDKRYEVMKENKVKNISDMKNMKYKFVIIDEYADLTMKSDVDHYVQLLSQKGRACGIHLIIATQRASTKIMSGDLKVNFSCKAIFKMSKAVDSRVMMDEDGAEKLLGMGDMLFSFDGSVDRLQGFNSIN